MPIRRVIAVLLLIEILLFTHLLMTLTQTDPTAWIAAQGGHITYVNVAPGGQDLWGGAIGLLKETGATAITIQPGQIVNQDLHVENESCIRMELFASTVPIDVATIVPILPQNADSLLGLDSSNGISATSMFTDQLTFTVNNMPLTLYTTTTRSQLGTFIQGIAAESGGSVVFVTRTVGNGRGFDGTAANYQFILPVGTWQVSRDETDTCPDLDDDPIDDDIIDDEINLSRIFIITPDRVCVGQSQQYIVVKTLERILCRTVDEDHSRCIPTPADVTILADGEEVFSETTETGYFNFTPEENAKYVVTASADGKTYRKSFKSGICRDYGADKEEDQLIRTPSGELEDTIPPPRQERPEDTAAIIAQVEYVLIVWITALITLLSAITYYEAYKNTSVRLLKARIWVLEKLKGKE